MLDRHQEVTPSASTREKRLPDGASSTFLQSRAMQRAKSRDWVGKRRSNGGQVWGRGISPNVVWYVVRMRVTTGVRA